MDTRGREKFLIHVMNQGFERAASSFSKMVGKSVTLTSSKSLLVKFDESLSYISEEPGELYVLTTNLIGEISGKSFLIFNKEESDSIFRTISPSMNKPELNEAFLMEIDNIISASVISDLSNSLDIELYGDVPKLSKILSHDLQEFMEAEIQGDDLSMLIFANTNFHFDNQEQIHPQFIWKLNSKVFDLIPLEKISV